MKLMKGTADEFIAAIGKEFEQKQEKLIPFKDINRKGKHLFKREAWVFHKQHNEKVFVFERLKRDKLIEPITHNTANIGDVEYRLGYYIVAKNGERSGCWIWGQYCPLIPLQDWEVLLTKAKKKGVIL